MNTRNHPIEAEELMAYLDGELAPEQGKAAAEHLETCMECQQLAADLRGVSQTLNTWELQPTNSTMPKSLAAAVEEHIPELQPALAIPTTWYRRPWLRSWAPVVGTLAVIAILITGAHIIGSYGNSAYSTAGLSTRDAVPSDEPVAPASPALSHSTASPQITLNSPGHLFHRSGPAGSVVPQGGFAYDGQARDKAKSSLNGLPIGGPKGQFDRLQTFSKLQTSPSTKSQFHEDTDVPAQVGQGSGAGRAERSADLLPTGPMIIRTAELSLTTREFDKGRVQVEEILKHHRGYVATLNVTGAAGTGRTLTASLRIPSTQLDAALTELKALGRLVSESKSGQEITAQYVDLQARLNNSRNTEKRLIDLLDNRTGKLSDVLEVENELARVRGEIESMEAERKSLSNQVDFATMNLTLAEDYRAQLQVVPPSTSTRLINAAVEGYRSMVDGLMSIALFFLSSGPTLLVWAAILFFPARFTWNRLRRSLSGARS